MTEAVLPDRGLKEANNKLLFTALLLNVAAFHFIVQSAGNVQELMAFAGGSAVTGVGAALVGLLTSLISADMKARLIFLRWKAPLPGSRAFSKYGPADARVNMQALGQKYGRLPRAAKKQNSLWYSILHEHSDRIEVRESHRAFLLARDCAILALIIMVVFGGLALPSIRPNPLVMGYIAFLVVQWLVPTIAANITGKRLVTTVMAVAGLAASGSSDAP